MFTVTDNAASPLRELLSSEQARDKHLVIYFQGFG